MSKLIITVGCPGSGKTTWANKQCKKSIGSMGLVSFDSLRVSLFGNITKEEFFQSPVSNLDNLETLYEILKWNTKLLFKIPTVKEVIVCNTNLTPRSIGFWTDFAKANKHQIEFVLFPRTTPYLMNVNKVRPKEDRVPKAFMERCIVNFRSANKTLIKNKQVMREIN